jgi:hypothetical protein
MPDGLSRLPEESAGRPDAMANDIQSVSLYGSAILRHAQNIWGTNGQRYCLDHLSWRAIIREDNLLVYWASKGQNAPVIWAKMDGCSDPSTFSYPWVTKWIRAMRRGEGISELSEESGKPKDPLASLKVVDFLNLNRFADVRQIATATKILQSIVFNHLNGWSHAL